MPPEPIRLRILTVNAHKGFTSFNRRFILHELREALREARPDLVFLQEVLGEHQRHAARHARWPTVSQYEFLADTLWSAYAYGRNAVYPDGHHGNAVLSKYPIVSHRNEDLSVGAAHEPRGMLHCVLDVRDAPAPLHALCVHLGLREAHRQEQLRRLCAYLRQHVPAQAAALLAGDFNDWRQRADATLARCGLADVHRLALGHAARTFPATCPLLRLDRIYVRNVAASEPRRLSRRPWSRLSDHVPLAAEVTL